MLRWREWNGRGGAAAAGEACKDLADGVRGMDSAKSVSPAVRPALCTSGPSGQDGKTIANRASNGESYSLKGPLGTLPQTTLVVRGS